MQFFNLPLLAALQHYTPNDDTWKNGMEVKYNMTYNSKTILPYYPNIAEAKTAKSITTNISAGIICQLEPNNPERMQCNMMEPDILLSMQYINGTMSQKVDRTHSPSIFEFFDNNFKFNVTFDKFGIEDVMVTLATNIYYDDMRMLVYPLHAGLDLDNLTVGNYEATDRFWTGNCETKYEVMMIHEVIGEPAPVEKGKWEDGKSIIINKIRDMEKCPSRVQGYIPPTTKPWIADGSKTRLDMKSSESHIVADNTKFISMTKFDGLLYFSDSDDTKPARVDEEIKFEYVSVLPVTNKLAAINNPKLIGLVFGQK